MKTQIKVNERTNVSPKFGWDTVLKNAGVYRAVEDKYSDYTSVRFVSLGCGTVIICNPAANHIGIASRAWGKNTFELVDDTVTLSFSN